MKKSTLISLVLFAVFAVLGRLYTDAEYLGITFLIASAVFATTAFVTAIRNRNGAHKND